LDATKHPEIKKAANDGGEVVDLKSGHGIRPATSTLARLSFYHAFKDFNAIARTKSDKSAEKRQPRQLTATGKFIFGQR